MQNIEIKFKNKEISLFLRDEVDISVMREIFKFQEYKKAEKVIVSAVSPILDVGAHAGFFSIYAWALNENAKIFALEPEPENLKMLEKNLKANNIKNVKIIVGALAQNTEKRILTITKDNQNHFLADAKRTTRLTPNDKWVQSYSLADVFKENKIKKLSLIKMDIEGGEYEILENLKTNEFHFFENIILEYHDTQNNHHQKIEQILRENKFGVQTFPSKFDKTMGFIFANNKNL